MTYHCRTTDDGIVHRASDTSCVLYRTYDLTSHPVTCLRCIGLRLSHECGHHGALIRSCPVMHERHRDYEQRCQCCETCADRCLEQA